MVEHEVITESELRVVFDAAPVSLWIEDFSGVKSLLDGVRSLGIVDFVGWATVHPEFVEAAMSAIRIVDVNASTLRMLKASSVEELKRRSGEVLREDMQASFVHELAILWAGDLFIETEGINYALDGTPVDVLLRRTGLPGHEHDWRRVLVSMVDISDRKRHESELALSEGRAVAMFEHSPVSLWIEDFSGLKRTLDDLRASGVRDLVEHMRTNPGFVAECFALVKVVDVNQKTLQMYHAGSKQELISRVGEVFRGTSEAGYAHDLLSMWNGMLGQETEGINHTLDGDPIDIHVQWRILPGHEASWDRALLSITDITARKRADEYMHYLGTHDTLTGLYNRSYFDDQVRRMQASITDRVASLIIADLNGLKQVNDQFGHSAGDLLIRRAGEVLSEATDDADVAARIGGDEFAVLMPGRDEAAVSAMVRRIDELVDVNNQFHAGQRLRIAIGSSTMRSGMTFGEAFKLADRRMYERKAVTARAS